MCIRDRFVSISQSGETADTLAALRAAKERGYLSTLTICNVAESSLVRESALALLTRAGREIGVASTKAFTTQLVALRLLSLLLGRQRGLSESAEAALVRDLELLPRALEKADVYKRQGRSCAPLCLAMAVRPLDCLLYTSRCV